MNSLTNCCGLLQPAPLLTYADLKYDFNHSRQTMKWLYEQGHSEKLTPEIFDQAASRNRLDTMKWMIETGGRQVVGNAAYILKHHDLELLKWWRNSGGEWRIENMFFAVSSGDLQLVQWMHENGCPITEDHFRHALAGEFREALFELLHSLTPFWDASLCSAAVVSDLENLIWLRSRKCPWDEETCARAAQFQKFGGLKWARENGCPWDERVCNFAAHTRHLEMLQWALDNGCEFTSTLVSTAIEAGDHNILDFLLERGILQPDAETIGNCREHELHQWLNEHNLLSR